MTQEQAEQFIDRMADGLIPFEAYRATNPNTDGLDALRELRTKIGHLRFRQVMRAMVMPNRIAFEVTRKAAYVETTDEWTALRDRILQALNEVKPHDK